MIARLRYGHFIEYYKRFGYEEENLQYKYDQRRSRFYLFSYTKVKLYIAKLCNITTNKSLIPYQSFRDNPKYKNIYNINCTNRAILEGKNMQRIDEIIKYFIWHAEEVLIILYNHKNCKI